MNAAELDDTLADRFQAAFTGGTPFGDSCWPDVQYEDPLTMEPLRGIDELEAHSARLRQALPDLRLERSGERLSGGAYACLPWRLVGTHKGDVGAVPASGRFLALHGMHYLELQDGRIRRARGFFDLYDAATQLGLLPAHGTFGETALLLLRGFGLRST